MTNDIVTMVWKEWREQFGGRGWKGMGGLVATIVIFGVVLPLQFGTSWVESPALLLMWSWVPMFLVMTVIADAIAGERERHTLETLLASPAPDHAIVLGKMAAAVAYGFGVTATCLVVSAATMAVSTGRPPVFPPLQSLVLVLAIALGGAILVAALGTLVSLYANTVRQAVQWLAGSIITLLLGPIVLARTFLPSLKSVVTAHPEVFALLPLAVAAVLFIVDAAAVTFVLSRFQRPRLVGR